ncbi:MAG TPA: alpha/beta hydrolase [Burkholderiales bacterium]|nr:alpha/beta hydrolase [Burkholderiales bacterium]
MFPGFREDSIDVGEVAIRTVSGGSGPPLLLLHGYPQTHVIWRKVAPRLAERFTVVATDLRGYGDSSKPPGAADHSTYSKRRMALDQVEVMRALGHERFAVCGHDRGGRVAHRMAVDHPERITKLAVLDIAPTKAMYEQTTMAFACAYYHWFFLIQPPPMPETLIAGNPEAYLRHHMARHAGLAPFMPDGWPAYLRAFSDPAAVHASCEDYRAAASIDLEHDAADIAGGRKLTCPLLALWGAHGVVERLFKALDEWRKVATDVRGRALPCGHYIPEEAPDALLDELAAFFGKD